MAIYHATSKPVSRSNGHSVTAKSAYIACKKNTDMRTGEVFNYSRKQGFLGGDIVLPDGIDLIIDSETLWNSAELSENRKDARVGREWEISLPHELNQEQRNELAKDITKQIANRYQVACEYALHAPAKQGDDRNYHVHILTTTRKIDVNGALGAKSDIELENKKAIQLGIPKTQEQISQIRKLIADTINNHLKIAQIDERVSHLSLQDQGIERLPSVHKGKAVTEMERRGVITEVTKINNERSELNNELIQLKEQVFSDGDELAKLQSELHEADQNIQTDNINLAANRLLTDEQVSKILQTIEYHDSVFTRDNVAKHLKQSFTNYQLLNKAVDEITNAKNVLSLGYGDDGKERFTTFNMLAVERNIQSNVSKLQQNIFANLSDKTINDVLANYELLTGKKLTNEQNNAVRHIVSKESISCIVGRAGTGKSFSLAAAKAIWDNQGNQVLGVALSGIAADGLKKDANMDSRTIASFLLCVENGSVKLNNKTVIVMDEAGMTDSISMQKVVQLAENSGAKIVLVGDPAQLQPVGPGASFRAILEKTGFAEIQTVYRQKEQWQRDATVEFSKANTGNAIQAYADNGCVHFLKTSNEAINKIAEDHAELRQQTGKDISKFLIVAHRNADVQLLNETVRINRVANGEIADGYTVKNNVSGKEREIKIAQNDRIVFLQNDKKLGVANGRFATVTSVNFGESGKVIDFNVKLDGSDNQITINPENYNNFDYGYAATVHKTQGVTVDHSFVYGGGNLNSSLTYVAMTRHKETTALYASSEQYGNLEVLKERVSRLDTKDSVLNYLDEIDDYAGRRGLETNHKTLKQIVVDSLRNVKDKLVKVFDQENQAIHQVDQAQGVNSVVTEEAPQKVNHNQYAVKVADYVQARKNFAMAYNSLKPKLEELGLKEIPKDKENLAILAQYQEYRDLAKTSSEVNRLAFEVTENLERSKIALQLNKVDIDKLQAQAAKHEVKLTVGNYAKALKDNAPERFKLAYEITKDIKAHYPAIKANNLDTAQLNYDSSELALAYALDKSGLKELASQSPAFSYIGVVQQQTKTKLGIEEKELQDFLTEYTETKVVQSHLFKEVTTKHNQDVKDPLKHATAKLNQLRANPLANKLAAKYNAADYTMLKQPNYNGGIVQAYQRALQGKSTAEDYAATSQDALKLSQQINIGKSIKR